MNKLESARLKYKPKGIKLLFIAEAPPENFERFFYYEDVKEKDALFINLIRVLYPEYRKENGTSVSWIREHKKELLKRFQRDGYYLIDALLEPISLKSSPKWRIKRIKLMRSNTLAKINELMNNNSAKDFRIVLIKSTVHEALNNFLTDANLPVINRETSVPFPSHGHSARFASQLHKILSMHDMGYRGRTKFVSYSGDVIITRED